MGTGDMTSHETGSVLEEKVKQAIIDELKRQAEIRPDGLRVSTAEKGLSVSGEIDLDDLAMVVIGSLAGGP
ncbi:hypothetical protein [Chelativorans sp.]|uniref:hypothetical protein n=1 Tax=Chelativorans sp. TaxID=2203393 RepID=UPI0028124102|nr:hypothetical protein [Chelativorans sp.]